MAQDSTGIRLERMEEKIDKLSEAIIALARVEEKIINLEQTNSTIMKQIMSIEEQSRQRDAALNQIKIEHVKDSDTLQGLRKLFWMALSAILGAGFLVWFTILSGHSNPHVP
jgi:phage shock protein A